MHCNQFAPPAKDEAGAAELDAMRRTLRKRGDFVASDVYTPPAATAAGASSGASGPGSGGKGTLLSKIFGAYSIQMYWHTEYFCVMENAFPPKGSIQEMYDLKGSKTDRSATRLKDGAIAMCKFCEQRFVVGGAAEKNCPFRVRHEGVQLLKVRTDRAYCYPLRFTFHACDTIIPGVLTVAVQRGQCYPRSVRWHSVAGTQYWRSRSSLTASLLCTLLPVSSPAP